MNCGPLSDTISESHIAGTHDEWAEPLYLPQRAVKGQKLLKSKMVRTTDWPLDGARQVTSTVCDYCWRGIVSQCDVYSSFVRRSHTWPKKAAHPTKSATARDVTFGSSLGDRPGVKNVLTEELQSGERERTGTGSRSAISWLPLNRQVGRMGVGIFSGRSGANCRERASSFPVLEPGW